jgi:undecaprenyl-diphosphatase
MATSIVDPLLLGIVEGATEFLPVSSTAHILLLGELLGFDSPGKAFEVLIQLGAILALLSVYAARLWHIAVTLPTSARSRHFTIGVIIAFLPAAIAGALLHDLITRVLFESVLTISIMLIAGGVVLLYIDRLPLRPLYGDVMNFPLGVYLGIGLFQMLALVPGVSRSGATIVGAMLLGSDKRSAAEFSFFLAMPTMLGAFVFSLAKNASILDFDAVLSIVIGFVAAFVSAVIVVRLFLGFVARRGFAPFGWWRIVVGILGLVSVFFFSAPEPTLSDPDAPAVTAPEAPAVRDVTAPDVPPAPGDSAAPTGDDALGDLIREQGQP